MRKAWRHFLKPAVYHFPKAPPGGGLIYGIICCGCMRGQFGAVVLKNRERHLFTLPLEIDAFPPYVRDEITSISRCRIIFPILVGVLCGDHSTITQSSLFEYKAKASKGDTCDRNSFSCDK